MGYVNMEIVIWILAGAVVVLAASGFAMCRRWKKAAEASYARRIDEIGEALDFSEALIANTPDGFLVSDDQLTIIKVNEAFCRITGRPETEFVGRRPPYPGELSEEHEKLMEHFDKLRRGVAVPMEVQYERKDGERIPLWFSPGTFETADGKRYFFAIVKELSQLRKTENELRESEAIFRRIAETSADAIYLIDPKGIITYISPAVETILGYTQDEFAGTDFAVHFSDEDLAPAREAFVRNMHGEDVRGVELRIRHKNGDPVVIEVNGTPIRRDGEIVGVQGMARDITRRKLAEEALRQTEIKFEAQYRGLPIPVYTWQKQGDDFVLI
ncbi:MAG: PAS domain S-box protein, partial [Candidatus Latescibacterota bacterium]